MVSNAAAGFLDGATTLAGPLLASVLLGMGGPAWAVGVTVVLLAAAALFAGWLPAPPTMALEATQRSPGHALRTLFHTPEASSAVSDHALAEAFGLLEALIQIAMALGAAVAGVLLHWFDARTSLLIVGLLLPVVAMIAAPFLRRFDARLGHRDLGVELLRRQPVFADLPMPVLDNLGARLAPVGFAAGEVIMSEGDHGDQYVLIVEGVVTFTQLGAVVNVLERGGSFGEIALMRDVRGQPPPLRRRPWSREPSIARHSWPRWGVTCRLASAPVPSPTSGWPERRAAISTGRWRTRTPESRQCPSAASGSRGLVAGACRGPLAQPPDSGSYAPNIGANEPLSARCLTSGGPGAGSRRVCLCNVRSC